MTIEEFERCLLIYGTQVERWPPVMRARAARFVGSGVDVSRCVARAAPLDTLLAAAWMTPRDAAAERVIRGTLSRIGTAASCVQPARPSWRGAARWLPCGVLAAAALAGCGVGVVRPDLAALWAEPARPGLIQWIFAPDAIAP